LEELLEEMSEFFLQSGFQYGFQDIGNPHDLDALRQAIIEKLVEMGRIPEDLLQQWLDDRSEGDAKRLDELIDKLIRQMLEEGCNYSSNNRHRPRSMKTLEAQKTRVWVPRGSS